MSYNLPSIIKSLSAGYSMRYHYDTERGRHYRMSDVAETHYRTEGYPTPNDETLSTHSYAYDPNGNHRGDRGEETAGR